MKSPPNNNSRKRSSFLTPTTHSIKKAKRAVAKNMNNTSRVGGGKAAASSPSDSARKREKVSQVLVGAPRRSSVANLSPSESFLLVANASFAEARAKVFKLLRQGKHRFTPFQLGVWASTYLVPKGSVASYRTIGNLTALHMPATESFISENTEDVRRGSNAQTSSPSSCKKKDENNSSNRIIHVVKEDVLSPERGVSYQAVGQALSKNPLAPIVPCHRVTGLKGDLVGFKGCRTELCLEEKAAMLKKEGVLIEKREDGNYCLASPGSIL